MLFDLSTLPSRDREEMLKSQLWYDDYNKMINAFDSWRSLEMRYEYDQHAPYSLSKKIDIQWENFKQAENIFLSKLIELGMTNDTSCVSPKYTD